MGQFSVKIYASPGSSLSANQHYGLTSDIPEQLELRRPSEIPLINDQKSASISFISKDDV
jgi:hypothetical protein